MDRLRTAATLTVLALATTACGGLGGHHAAAAATTSKVPLTTPPAAVATSASTCTSKQLTPAMNHIAAQMPYAVMTVSLQNTGSTCVLEGYPRLSLLLAAPPTKIQTIDGHVFAIPPVKVAKQTLVHGANAYFVLTYPVIAAKGQTCALAQALGIAPPNHIAEAVLNTPWNVCGPVIHVTPMDNVPPPL